MILSKSQFALVSLLLGGAAVIVISQHRAHMALGSQNALLHQKLAHLAAENVNLSNRLFRTRTAPVLSLPDPSMQNVAAAQPAEALCSSNRIAHVAHGGEVPPLTAAQVQRYLEENHRSAASLLAAYRTSHDPALLQEAMEKYPADPKVAFEAALSKELSPAARQEWLEAFKKAAPEDPLPTYLSARDYFKSGQTDHAVQELIAGAGRPGFADCTVERIQMDEEAYRAAGYSEAEAKMAATWGVALPNWRT